MKQLNQTPKENMLLLRKSARWLLCGLLFLLLSPALHAQCNVTISGFSGDTVVCPYSTETYSVSSQSGHGYAWQVIGGTIKSGQGTNSITVQWDTGWAYIYLGEYDSLNSGCYDSVFVNVSIATPYPYFTGENKVCANTTVGYKGPSNNNYTYSWKAIGGQISGSSTGSSVNVNWGSAGTGSLMLTVDNNGCTDSFGITVNIGNPTWPTGDILLTSTACSSDSVALEFSTKLVNVTEYSVTWSVTGANNIINSAPYSNEPRALAFFPNPGTYYVTAQVYYLGQCSHIYDTLAVVVSQGLPTISGATSAQTGQTLAYSLSAALPSSATLTVTGGRITQSSGTSYTIEWDSIGLGKITISDNTNTCDTLKELLVCVKGRMINANNVRRHYCYNETINLSTKTIPGATYQWSANNGTVSGSNSSQSVSVQLTSSGPQVIIASATVGNCTVTDTFWVIVATQSLGIAGPATICPNSTEVYTATDKNIPSGSATWHVSNGTILQQSSTSVIIQWGSTGGTVSLVRTLANCLDSTDKVVGTNPPDTTYSYQTTGCAPAMVSFIAQSTDTTWKYSWESNGQTIGSGRFLNYTFGQGGQYPVKLVMSRGNCVFSSTQTIDMAFPPSSTFTLSDSMICLGDDITATITNHDTTATYGWDFGDNTAGMGNTVNHTYTSAGSYTMMAMVQSAKGCTSTYIRYVYVYPRPTPIISQSGFTLSTDTTQINYQWYKDGDTIPGATNATYNVTETGTYSVSYGDNQTSCIGYSSDLYVYYYNTISGVITTSANNSLQNQQVYLVQINWADTSLTAIDTTYTDSSGYYEFQTNDSAVYVLAWPDSASYPGEMPTYYDSALTIFQAVYVQVQQGNTTVSFSTISGTNPGGSGFIGGRIFACNACKWEKGQPVNGIRIILLDENKKPVAHTYTDADGAFSFPGLTLQKYSFIVDYPGIDNDNPPVVELNASQSTKDQVVLELFPDHLELVSDGTGFGKPAPEATQLEVFPNPFHTQLSIRYELTETAPVQVSMLDLSGRTILSQSFERLQPGQQILSIDHAGTLQPGIYLLQLQVGDAVVTKRVVRMQ